MVLEEITKEVTDAESNAENKKNSFSGTSTDRVTPEQRSTGTEVTPKEQITQAPQVLLPGGGLFAFLEAVREDENEFPDGFAMEEGVAVDDVRLHRMHDRWRSEECQNGVALDVLIRDRREDLKTSFLKFLDTVIGYVLYIQQPSQIGTTSGVPLDSLVALWVVPEYQSHGHEKRMMHWWLRTAVRSVKYFTMHEMTFAVKDLLQSEGFKIPKTATGHDQPNYIAMI